MKPIYLVTGNFRSGGIAAYLNRLIEEGTRKNQAFFVVITSAAPKEKNPDYEVIELPVPRLLDFWPLKEIIFACRAQGFLDLLHDQTIVLNYSVWPGRFFKNNRVISVVHSLHGQFWRARGRKSPLRFALALCHLGLRWLDRSRLKRSWRNVFVSKRTLEEYSAQRDDVHVPNFFPISSTRFQCPPADRKVILCVGRLDPFKGLDLFGALAKAYWGRFEFIFAGDGLKSLKGKYPEVQFTGLLGYAQLQELYQKTLLQVSTSYVENMPSVVFEAIENSVPIIASDVGDCSKILAADYVFTPDRFDSLKTCFDRALSRIQGNPDQVTRDFNSCKDLIRAHYSTEQVYRQLSRLLTDSAS